MPSFCEQDGQRERYQETVLDAYETHIALETGKCLINIEFKVATYQNEVKDQQKDDIKSLFERPDATGFTVDDWSISSEVSDDNDPLDESVSDSHIGCQKDLLYGTLKYPRAHRYGISSTVQSEFGGSSQNSAETPPTSPERAKFDKIYMSKSTEETEVELSPHISDIDNSSLKCRRESEVLEEYCPQTRSKFARIRQKVGAVTLGIFVGAVTVFGTLLATTPNKFETLENW